MDLTGWTAFYAIATAITGFILLLTFGAILCQISRQNRANLAQAYAFLISWVQNEEIRLARRKLFELGDEQKKVEDWQEDEVLEVEKVCHTYDTIGVMWREKILPEKIVAYWGISIVRSWNIAEPLVTEYRKRPQNSKLWESFGNLANKMKELRESEDSKSLTE